MDYHYKQTFLLGYGEVDDHNRMRLSALINYLQDVATMHSKMVGYGTTKCKEIGMAWMTLTWHIKVFSYPQGDTNIEVKTWSRGIKACHASRAFEITDEDGNLVAHADSMWAWVDVYSKKPMRPSIDMVEGYGAIERMLFENEKVRISIPEKIDSAISFHVQRRDIDTNMHCNNTKYIEYALEAIPQETYENKQIEELEIVYKKPVFYHEKIKVTCTQTQEDTFIHEIIKEDGEIATLVKTKWKQV